VDTPYLLIDVRRPQRSIPALASLDSSRGANHESHESHEWENEDGRGSLPSRGQLQMSPFCSPFVLFPVCAIRGCLLLLFVCFAVSFGLRGGFPGTVAS